MKAYFTRLLNYDQATNLQLLDGIIAAGEPEQALRLLAHLLTAKQVWLQRCKLQPQTITQLWPGGEAESLRVMMKQNHADWLSFMETDCGDDFSQYLHYKNQAGQHFDSTLQDILTHVINHGTHHRAQAWQLLKQAGTTTLPITDYIFYTRQL